MTKWFFTLQFRLVLCFALVLSLALVGVSTYISYAASKEVSRYQEEIEQMRAARVKAIVEQSFRNRRVSADAQNALEQAGALYGKRIVLSDGSGQTIADSNPNPPSFPPRYPGSGSRPSFRQAPIFNQGTLVGSISILPQESNPIPEPSIDNVASALKRSLLFAGLFAGFAGVLTVSIGSRRILYPVRSLSQAANRLGRGDLTQRVSENNRDEIGQLSRTFNTMANNLQAQEIQKRNLMADVAHELRTPVSNIRGYLEAIRDGLIQPYARTLDTIYQQVIQLGHIIEDLRILALAEAGSLTLNRQVTQISPIIESVVAAFNPQAIHKKIALTFMAEADLPLVNLDEVRIRQVVSNLLDNALRHTPEGGSIEVKLNSPEGKSVEISVQDNGEGIPPDALPRIFDRMYRVDPSRSRSSGGAGLGLAIARSIVEMHGGSITAESAPGQGAKLTFNLPKA